MVKKIWSYCQKFLSKNTDGKTKRKVLKNISVSSLKKLKVYSQIVFLIILITFQILMRNVIS